MRKKAFMVGTFVAVILHATAGGEDYQSALKAAHGYGVFTYGMHAYSDGRKDHALAAFTMATEEDPSIGRAHFHRGDVLFERGEFADAKQAYLTAIEIEPDFTFAHYNLACALARIGEAADALGRIEAAFRLGYDRFDRISKDADLAAVTSTPEFAALVEKYRNSGVKRTSTADFLLGSLDDKVSHIENLLESDGSQWESIARKALLDSNHEIRLLALALHERFDEGDQTKVFVRGLYDNNGYVNKFAGNALIRIGMPAMPYIDAILESDDEGAKFYAGQIKKLVAEDASKSEQPN